MMGQDVNYKTLGVFCFDNLWLGIQRFDSGWGRVEYRIAQFSPDLKTVIDYGKQSSDAPALFKVQGRTFIAPLKNLGLGMRPHILYEISPPPDSAMAQRSVNARAQVIMQNHTKCDFADILGISKEKASGISKEELAERVIRLKDKIDRMFK